MANERVFCTYVCQACDYQWFMMQESGVFSSNFEVDCPECEEPTEPAQVEEQGESSNI